MSGSSKILIVALVLTKLKMLKIYSAFEAYS